MLYNCYIIENVHPRNPRKFT